MLYYWPKQDQGIFMCSGYDGIGEYDGPTASVFTTGGYAYPTKKAKTGRNISFTIQPADGTAAYCKREVAKRIPKEEVLIRMTTTQDIAYWTRAWLTHVSFPTFVNGVRIVLDFSMQVDYFAKEVELFTLSGIASDSFSLADYAYSGPVIGGLFADTVSTGATLDTLSVNLPTLQYGGFGCLGVSKESGSLVSLYPGPAFFSYLWRPAQITWPIGAEIKDIMYDSAIIPQSTWLFRDVGRVDSIPYSIRTGWTLNIYATEYVL
jgi:hypothetical protein